MKTNLPRLAVFALALAAAGCSEQPQRQAAAPPPPQVTVANPTKQIVIDYDDYVGRFVAVDSVDVRARVAGYLEKIHFTDGQMVKQGDLLFTIDRRPFEIDRDRYRADLEQARANLSFTEDDLARAKKLVRERTISEQTYDQRLQSMRVAKAIVNARQAQLRQAELDLGFTEVRAQLTGRIGDRRVSPGNLVAGGDNNGNATLLATIVTSDPIRFEFTFDEASYLRYERLAKTGTDVSSHSGGVDVTLKLLDEDEFEHQGRMDFVDNVIDRNTGTIRGRAQFANKTGIFTPGMFARIRVPGTAPYTALLVPEVAIATEQTRKYVLVVNADNVVQQKHIVLGQAVGDRRVVRKGLTPTDRVIVNGLMRARPGMKVSPKEEGPPKKPGSEQAAAQPASSTRTD